MGLGLLVGDAPEVWASLGFTVDSDGASCAVGGVVFALGGERRGVRAWSLDAVDGLESFDGGESFALLDPPPPRLHPNGVVELDHLVITTPDFQRTIDAFGAAGFDLRRVRETSTYGAPMKQGFFKYDGVVLEVVGPDVVAGDGPARFWGLAFVCSDLDETAAFLGDRLHPPKDAVQQGRRIATLDRAAGATVPIAFMSR